MKKDIDTSMIPNILLIINLKRMYFNVRPFCNKKVIP